MTRRVSALVIIRGESTRDSPSPPALVTNPVKISSRYVLTDNNCTAEGYILEGTAKTFSSVLSLETQMEVPSDELFQTNFDISLRNNCTQCLSGNSPYSVHLFNTQSQKLSDCHFRVLRDVFAHRDE